MYILKAEEPITLYLKGLISINSSITGLLSFIGHSLGREFCRLQVRNILEKPIFNYYLSLFNSF